MASTPSSPPPYRYTEQSRDDMEPIDLTADDDDDLVELPPAKRQRLAPNVPPLHLGGLGGLNNQFRVSAIAPPSSLPMPIPRTNRWHSTPPFQNRAWSSQPNPPQHMPILNGNHTHYQSSQTRGGLTPQAQYASQPPRLTALPRVTAQTLAQNPYPSQQTNNVMWPKQPETIDLTRESSPLLTSSSIEHLEANAAVLIGQLNVTALVLYPNPYLSTQRGGIDEWAPIRIAIDPNAKPPNDALTLHIPPRAKGANPTPQDSFGVIGRSAGPTLAPLLSRGVVKLEPRIKRSASPNLNCMPLAILVFTPKGNVPHVSATLMQAGLILDHPTSVFDLTHILPRVKYYNPHNPPSGGFRATVNGRSNPLPFSKCTTPQVPSKPVEVQRSQVEDVFQKLRSEDDLKETSPGPSICTNLYPHQKKAVTFLLEREQEIVCPAGKAGSLWHPHGHAWQNVITQEIVFSKPRECKGALLADDMGLGKSLETLSLLATTMSSAQDFGVQPLDSPERPIDPDTAPGLTAAQFAGAAWGMPDTSKVNASKAKLKAIHEKKMIEYNRLSLLKERSRATLIVCPLSTLVSWEDQFKEHWGGEVQVVGGLNSSGFATTASSQAPTPLPSGFATGTGTGIEALGTMSLSAPNRPLKPGAPIRVYMYHGASRRSDPVYIANFDVVITTYSTLATEYSKQMRSGPANGQLDLDEDGGSSDGGVLEVDQDGNPVAKKKKPTRKRKICGGETASPLQAVHWFRVVLDEAHCIKETSTVASRACCDLIADRRLCLTGTPVQNKLDDLYALIKFLRVEPFDDKATWTAVIGNLVKFNDHLGVRRLQTLMKLLTLRRTKDTRGKDGKPILALPPRSDRMHVLKLTPEEREVYDIFFNESQAEFKNMAQNEIMRNYVNILQKILRLRQICDDLTLIKGQRAEEEDSAAKYEQAIADIAKEGINLERATAVFALLKDTSTAQCVECGMELAPSVDGANGLDLCGDMDEGSCKKARAKAVMKASRANSPSPPTLHPIITRCQHLFCLTCFRTLGVSEWPNVPQDTQIMCTACNCCIQASDAIEVRATGPEMMAGYSVKKTGMATPSNAKKERRQRGAPIVNYRPSTKTQALIADLLPFSKQNPYSTNYDPTVAEEIETVDEYGDTIDDGITKSVVFSQWTSMLDRIEEALEVNGIHFERLDGTMKREDRNRAMDALKNDPKCEVLLVSLKAGGVGLTLTAARRVYLMDPYWNPAVENQAVDRIHRLGQTHPVIAIKYIIENSIEQRLLEVQKKKADLANMTLGKPLSKHELQQRRLEELNKLLG